MSDWLEVTEERDDDIPAALAPFAFMTEDHVAQARRFLMQRTGASVADFDRFNGLIHMRWPGRPATNIYPWEAESLSQLNADERRAVCTVWDQMIDDLRVSVEHGRAIAVAQQSRMGPLVCIPARVWWLYRIEDWEVGTTNEIGSGDRLYGVFFRHPVDRHVQPLPKSSEKPPRPPDIKINELVAKRHKNRGQSLPTFEEDAKAVRDLYPGARRRQIEAARQPFKPPGGWPPGPRQRKPPN